MSCIAPGDGDTVLEGDKAEREVNHPALPGGAVGADDGLFAHKGFAVFADTWAPAGALLLVMVPALVAGSALGTCLARRDAGIAAPLAAVVAGYACAALLGWDFVAAGAGLLIACSVLAWLQPRHALLLGCLLMGFCALSAAANRRADERAQRRASAVRASDCLQSDSAERRVPRRRRVAG